MTTHSWQWHLLFLHQASVLSHTESAQYCGIASITGLAIALTGSQVLDIEIPDVGDWLEVGGTVMFS